MTSAPSDFLAAARAKCEEMTVSAVLWWLHGHTVESPRKLEMIAAIADRLNDLDRALSLIDSQTALLAARDAEIAGLKSEVRRYEEAAAHAARRRHQQDHADDIPFVED